MKLIDKIEKAHSNKLTDYSRVYTPTAEIIEKIADDYAIEFARFYKMANNNEYHLYPNASIEEHLEIYKKERNL
jgi:hypothetical protein